MKKHLLIALIALGLGLGLTLMVSTPSMAVHKNYDGQLSCGSCHTMHNSQGGAALNGTGDVNNTTIILLRGANVTNRATVHNLCLQCHASNGAQAGNTFDTTGTPHTAPKVYINGASGGGNDTDLTNGVQFDSIGAGGDFSADFSGNSGTGWSETYIYAQGKTHSLGATAVVPPGGDVTSIAEFSCTACHDPHGTGNTSTSVVNKYRNLKVNATGAGANSNITLNNGISSYVGMGGYGQAGFIGVGATAVHIWPLYKTNVVTTTDTCEEVGGNTNCYPVGVAANNSATDGISNFCAQCHDNWHEDISTSNEGVDWKRHPVDNTLTGDGSANSGAGTPIIDASNYQVNTNGLPVAKSSGALALNAVLNTADTGNARVFCLSCHFAHGGPNYDLLRWTYTSAVSSGDQTANSIGVTVGCQQCHNR